MDEQKIIDLEIRLAESDRQIEELSDTVAAQSQRLALLEERVLHLTRQAMSAATQGSVVLGDEPPPPHW